MALTEAQIINCLVILGLPARIDIAAGYTGGDGETLRKSGVARAILGQLNAAQETEITGVLTEYASIKYDADTIKAEGLDSDPARTRRRLARVLAQTIGLTWGGVRGWSVTRG
jgi:hypothetical protein